MNYPAPSNIAEFNAANALALTASSPHVYTITLDGNEQDEAVRVLSLVEQFDDMPERALLSAVRHYIHLEVERMLQGEELLHELKNPNSNLKMALDFARRKFEKGTL